MNDGIRFSELLDYNTQETARWKEWFAKHPDALALPCDIARATTVAELLFHIFAVELNFAHLVRGRPKPDFKALPRATPEELFAIHENATRMTREFLLQSETISWAEPVSVGFRDIKATRRKMLAQAMLHSVHHRAQLAALLRQRGYEDGWVHDILMSNALE